MRFRYTQKREWDSASQRSVVMAPGAMVASSQPLASHTGCKILAQGGNAVDAAVAMVSVLSVVEPHSVGIGGDAFALIYLARENRIIGLNASGRAPCRACRSWFEKHGMTAVPERGILSVTVPGALYGWAQAVKCHGARGSARMGTSRQVSREPRTGRGLRRCHRLWGGRFSGD